MMSKGILLGLAAAGAAAWWLFRSSWPAGHGPFDALPAGLGARTGPVRVTAPTTGLIYDTYSWPVTGAPTVTFNVAALASGQGWVSFTQDSSSGARSYVASYNQTVAGAPALSILQRDFNLA